RLSKQAGKEPGHLTAELAPAGQNKPLNAIAALQEIDNKPVTEPQVEVIRAIVAAEIVSAIEAFRIAAGREIPAPSVAGVVGSVAVAPKPAAHVGPAVWERAVAEDQAGGAGNKVNHLEKRMRWASVSNRKVILLASFIVPVSWAIIAFLHA